LEICAPSVSKQFASYCENLGGIKFDFANPIDTLKTELKTILLESSQYSKKIGTPTTINLNIVAEKLRQTIT
jgi:hypothetical protein